MRPSHHLDVGLDRAGGLDRLQDADQVARADAEPVEAVDQLLQAELGFTKNSPATLGVREGVQLAVYALIFEGVKNNLWQFKDKAAGDAFMRELDRQRKATIIQANRQDAPKS